MFELNEQVMFGKLKCVVKGTSRRDKQVLIVHYVVDTPVLVRWVNESEVQKPEVKES